MFSMEESRPVEARYSAPSSQHSRSFGSWAPQERNLPKTTYDGVVHIRAGLKKMQIVTEAKCEALSCNQIEKQRLSSKLQLFIFGSGSNL